MSLDQRRDLSVTIQLPCVARPEPERWAWTAETLLIGDSLSVLSTAQIGGGQRLTFSQAARTEK